MAWLCVNKNGQELICQNEPERIGFIRKETNSPFGILDKETLKRYYNKESKTENLYFWRDQKILGGDEYYIQYSINLSNGSIEKLIGEKLNWEDNAIEI